MTCVPTQKLPEGGAVIVAFGLPNWYVTDAEPVQPLAVTAVRVAVTSPVPSAVKETYGFVELPLIVP